MAKSLGRTFFISERPSRMVVPLCRGASLYAFVAYEKVIGDVDDKNPELQGIQEPQDGTKLPRGSKYPKGTSQT
jgi:hypothetical protein